MTLCLINCLEGQISFTVILLQFLYSQLEYPKESDQPEINANYFICYCAYYDAIFLEGACVCYVFAEKVFCSGSKVEGAAFLFVPN
jgi:hypothetical protein